MIIDGTKVLEVLKGLREEIELLSGQWTEGLSNYVQMADEVIAEIEGGP